MLKTALPITFLLIAACSASNKSTTFIPKTLSGDQAAVYIYRPSVMANALYSPDLLVNDEFKLSVKNSKKSLIILPTGETLFELDEHNNQSRLTSLLLNLKSETTYYLRVTTTLKINSETSYEPYLRSYNLENIAENKAKIEIAECCITNNKKTAIESEKKSKTLQTDDGFSVNKTQNPFSH
jgi:hypothetical protein